VGVRRVASDAEFSAKGVCVRAIAAALLALASAPAQAGAVKTPQCHADLTRAAALERTVSDRDRTLSANDDAAICAALRANLHDMAETTTLTDRYLTGNERWENLGRLRSRRWA
jgi:hypothetical protein